MVAVKYQLSVSSTDCLFVVDVLIFIVPSCMTSLP